MNNMSRLPLTDPVDGMSVGIGMAGGLFVGCSNVSLQKMSLLLLLQFRISIDAFGIFYCN